MSKEITAQVDSIYPGKVNISVFDSDAFLHGQLLAVGAYLHLEDGAGKVLIATVENISASGAGDEENMNGRMYRLEGQPLGMIVGDRFERGNTSIASSSDLFHEFCLNTGISISESALSPARRFRMMSQFFWFMKRRINMFRTALPQNTVRREIHRENCQRRKKIWCFPDARQSAPVRDLRNDLFSVQQLCSHAADQPFRPELCKTPAAGLHG